MKLAWTVATPDTADGNMLAWRGDTGPIFDRLAMLGYSGADLMVRDPALLDAAALDRLTRESGITIAAVSTGQLWKEDGLSLSSDDAKLRERTVDRMLAVVEFAARWSAQVNVGTLRGQLGLDRDGGKSRAAESLGKVEAAAAACRVTVAMEPQCKWVSNWLNTAGETVAWMRTWTAEPRILLDTYHALLEESSAAAAMIRQRRFISYVQVSDSNRLSPGSGSVHFGEILRVLHALDYDAFVCVECRQIPDSGRAAQQAAATLIPLLTQIGRETL